jgi:hypothetical protein
MSTYKSTGAGSTLSSYSVNLSEQHLYGSSRLGIMSRDVDMKAAYTQEDIISFYRGYKQYELSNHLGNVLVTITDKKTGVSTNGTTIDNYTADVSRANDYYPGGMLMPGRQFTTDYSYRYGQNGIEKVNEIAGVGNHYTALFGEYDPRTVRRWNLDPKPNPSISPYNMYVGNPIWHSDPLLDTIIVNDKGGTSLMRLDDGKDKLLTYSTEKLYKKGIQWFEPEGKNYMKALWTNPDIGTLDGIKHFSWNDIVNYADNHQNLVGYAHNGWWNDWKANKEGANGYYLSTVGGKLYWRDAVGQIPFAINGMRSGWGLATDYPTSKEQAIRNVVSLGQRFGGGLFGSPDKSNSYDNLMLLRGALYGAQRFTILRTTRDISIEYGMKRTITTIQIKTNPVNSNILGNPIDKQTTTQYGY